ncbi:MAG: hypothetical protein IIC15_05860, partial [Thaumarchaeota archaeon]|nr:hypothetical protein [Nitrososphaerota archaeon]
MNCSSCNQSYDNLVEFLCPSCGQCENMNLFLDIENYIRFLKNLVNKTSDLIEKLSKNGIPKTDFRREKLGASNILTLATIYDLADYDQDIRYDDSRIPKTLKENNPKMDEDLLQKVVENIDLRNKFSYLVLSLFQIENLYKELAIKMGFKGKETYYNIVSFVVNNSDVEDKEEKLHSLIVPSIIRNTLHFFFPYIGHTLMIFRGVSNISC